MALPVLAILGAFLTGLTAIVAAKLILAGLVIGLGYKYYDPINDYVQVCVLEKEAELAVYETTHDAVDEYADENNLTPEERASLHRDVDNQIKPDFLEDIARKLGISVDTLKFIILGIIVFLLLRG